MMRKVKQTIPNQSCLRETKRKYALYLSHHYKQKGKLGFGKLESGIFKMRWIHTIPIRLSKNTYDTFLRGN